MHLRADAAHQLQMREEKENIGADIVEEPVLELFMHTAVSQRLLGPFRSVFNGLEFSKRPKVHGTQHVASKSLMEEISLCLCR